MENKTFKVNSITMTMEQLNIITNDKGFNIIGLGEILNVLKQALDEKKPIFVEDKKMGKRYRLMEDSSLIEIK